MNRKLSRKTYWNAALLAAAFVTAGLPLPGAWSPTVSVARADEDLPSVPADAKKVEESSSAATFKVPAKGQVWLYDLNDKEVVHSITVNPGNTYSFVTKTDTVLVDRTPGPKMDLDPKHKYRIYYVNWSDRKSPPTAEEKEAFVIPKTAKHVADGKGINLSFTASAAGTIYLFDRTNGELVNVFRVHRDDVFVVEPKRDRIVENEKIILKKADLKTDVDYRLYFVARN